MIRRVRGMSLVEFGLVLMNVDGGKVLQMVDQECGICVSSRFAARDFDQQIQKSQKADRKNFVNTGKSPQCLVGGAGAFSKEFAARLAAQIKLC
jgi:hypothetical protein